jgi:hypothetical protein
MFQVSCWSTEYVDVVKVNGCIRFISFHLLLLQLSLARNSRGKHLPSTEAKMSTSIKLGLQEQHSIFVNNMKVMNVTAGWDFCSEK